MTDGIPHFTPADKGRKQRTNLPWWWAPYMRLARIMGWFGIPIITGWIVRKAAGR